MKIFLFIILLFIGCQPRQQNPGTKITTDPVPELPPAEAGDIRPENNYDYQPLYGIYDHESTTTGFAAVLTLTPYGNDIFFTVSVSQGESKGESEGVVTILDHATNFYTGFFDSEDCRMQFSFLLTEKKTDIKEVTLCSHHGSDCSFEGTYLKRTD